MTRPGWFNIDAHVAVESGKAPVEVLFGTDRATELGAYLAGHGKQRVLVVTGPHVGGDAKVMGPILEALGGLSVDTFLEVKRDKHISTVFEGIEHLRRGGLDAIVGVGGGGSLDTARQISALAADGRSMSNFQESLQGGTVPTLEGDEHTEVVLVPTTLAGADLSAGGSIEVLSASESPDGLPKRINPKTVAPAAVLYDPGLFVSTPFDLLAGSAMNGLNKGIETIYAPSATPYSDAVASRGVVLMTSGLLTLKSKPEVALRDVVAGLILVQLQRKISVLHAFGHALARHTTLQQGIAHAIVTPHALKLLLSQVELRRGLLGDALRQGGAGRQAADPAETVVVGVTEVRDSLGLPASFADLGLSATLDLDVLAKHVCDDALMGASPVGLAVEEARAVFEAAL